MSEFSLVIANIGLAMGHISCDTLSVIIFVFVITSIVSTYMIQYSDPLQKAINRGLQRLGLKDLHTLAEDPAVDRGKDIVLLGFFRVACSLLREIQARDEQTEMLHNGTIDKLVVIDFNPEVHARLRAHGVRAVYGDISHIDTLHHAGIHEAKVVLSTIPDNILVGTDCRRGKRSSARCTDQERTLWWNGQQRDMVKGWRGHSPRKQRRTMMLQPRCVFWIGVPPIIEGTD
jgi:hypothetical protein